MAQSGLKALAATVQWHGADLSPTVEMYLKAIVSLYDGKEAVSTSQVAHEVAVTSASASAMLKRLSVEGYVVHDGRHGVIPTENGARIGARTLRRQRLAERLLVDELKVPWEFAAAEACRLEHAISPLVETYLAAFVGDPSTCPHGHPIPTSDGTLWHHEETIELSEVVLDAQTQVVEVLHDMPEVLRFLGEIGLVPGAALVLNGRDRIAGLVTLRVGETERTVSLALANSILVRDPLAGQIALRSI